MKRRTGRFERNTKETRVRVNINLDGSGIIKVKTTIPFFDHMLTALAKHAGFDLDLQARGDTQVDDHHTVEDVGLVLGTAVKQALGDKRGIQRFGSAVIPMDETRVNAALDISDRPYLGFNLFFIPRMIKKFDLELLEEFFKAFTTEARMTLHVWTDLSNKQNSHHVAEAAFKATARALKQAVTLDRSVKGVPSTKGKL